MTFIFKRHRNAGPRAQGGLLGWCSGSKRLVFGGTAADQQAFQILQILPWRLNKCTGVKGGARGTYQLFTDGLLSTQAAPAFTIKSFCKMMSLSAPNLSTSSLEIFTSVKKTGLHPNKVSGSSLLTTLLSIRESLSGKCLDHCYLLGAQVVFLNVGIIGNYLS